MDADEEKLIARYLLGEMEEEEVERFEADYFASDEAAEKLEMARDHLIDRYLAVRLSARERERFESYFLDSPHNRDQLLFARALAEAVADERPSAWVSIAEFFKDRRALILATSILIAVTGFFLVRAFFAARPANEQTSVNNENSNHQAKGDEQETSANENRSSNERKKAGSSASVSLALTVRERGQEARLIIDENTESVSLSVPRPTVYGSYTVSIRPVGGEEVWSQNLGAGSSATVRLKIPAKLFSSQDYNLVIKAEAGGKREEIDGYYFRVERKP
jgi:hypothetical protein